MTDAILRVENLQKHYPLKRRGLFAPRQFLRAVDGVTFQLAKGETLALVGESGCGKSTTGKSILRLVEPTGGTVWFKDRSIGAASKRELRTMRREMQIVLQDPYASLNQRMTAAAIIAEPLWLHGFGDRTQRRERVRELMEIVGLRPDQESRYPHEFSGGQRQRIAIARGLALNPELVVADEPVSALDVSIQAQIINLMTDLQDRFKLTYLFISHDLAVVHHIADRVAVMYLGKIVEIAEKRALYRSPRHPYTRALLSAVPSATQRSPRERILLKGDAADASGSTRGCRFYARCSARKDICREVDPPLRSIAANHHLSCHMDL